MAFSAFLTEFYSTYQELNESSDNKTEIKHHLQLLLSNFIKGLTLGTDETEENYVPEENKIYRDDQNIQSFFEFILHKINITFNYEIYSQLATISENFGNPSVIKKLYLKSLEIEENNPEGWIGLSKCLFNEILNPAYHDPKEYEEKLRPLIKSYNELFIEDFMIDVGIVTYTPTSITQYDNIMQGLKNILKCLNRAIRLDGRSIQARFQKAELLAFVYQYTNRGRENIPIINYEIEQIKMILHEILEFDPNHIKTLFFLAKLENNTVNIKAPVHYLEKILEIEPGNINAKRELARAYMNSFDMLQAQAYIEEVVKLEPNNPENWIAYVQVSSEYFPQKTIDGYNKLLEFYENNHVIWFNITKLYINLKDKDNALMSYEKCKEFSPPNWAGLDHLNQQLSEINRL
ncbi:MAG: hypothetical protein OEZ01_02370 [Candidatus Heimdallarchaeota archaeon]|nr:hypothetical protein [Candidatus Heimdallarchaeota archaeon]MDH5644821.1 hypothetical protein [Candidatus Heimdallarchaeota archaeon]